VRALVVGALGQLGRELSSRLGDELAWAGGRDGLDVTDESAVFAFVAQVKPDVVFNATAWNRVDAAEAEAERAFAVNAHAPRTLARAASDVGARLVHVSTDYVFDGSKREPWVESDPVAPLQAYGRTKLAGERAVADANPEHAIVRAAWLFGAGGPNFVATMLRLGAERDEVTVVTDQRGGPTWTGHLAAALVEVAEREGDVGLFHASGNGACSWYEFAVEIFDRARMRCRVVPTTSERMARPARRPAYSVLGTEREPGIVLPPWQDGLASYLAEQAGTGAAAA